jgi:hypothetical protein
MAREMFKNFKLGFLVIGHTHEDIDGCFGYFPKKLSQKSQTIIFWQI